jgi:exopolysaccharide biosynthesis polyprenyl glycosylphosphotransferase
MLIIVAVADVAVKIVVGYSGVPVEMNVYKSMLPFMVIVCMLLFNIYGLFSLTFKKYHEVIVSLAVAMMNMMIILMAISFFIREFSYSRSILLVAMVLQFILLATWKYFFWRLENALVRPRRALLLGNRTECERVVAHLEDQPHLKYMVKYVCLDGRWQPIADEIDLFIVCSELPPIDKADIIHYCHIHNKQALIVPGFYELFCSSVSLDKIDDIPVFRPRYLRPSIEQRTLKRIFDIAVSLVVLLFLWPFFIVIALAIKLDSAGPVFYTQIRCGMDEKPFRIFKFRTMRQDAEFFTGPVLAEENDQRITAVGRFLRATRIDELPQFLNVLLGNMSTVGPRPERPFFVAKFKQDMPEYVYRHNVKPGITGMAQVYGKYNTIPRDKLAYDLIYIQQYNVITDLMIILQTLKVLVFKSSTQGVKRDPVKTDLSKYRQKNVGRKASRALYEKAEPEPGGSGRRMV